MSPARLQVLLADAFLPTGTEDTVGLMVVISVTVNIHLTEMA